MRHAITNRLRIGNRLRLGVAALGVVVVGCGSTTNKPLPPVTASAHTSHGLSYSVSVTGSGGQQCVTATYSSPLANGRPIVDTSHSCGLAGPGHPVLVQAHSSTQSLLTDVTDSGCPAVRAGTSAAKLRTVVTRCTASVPAHRVAILPAARRLVVAGVPGAPVINFPRHVCSSGICITPLLQIVVPKPTKRK